MRKLVLFSKKYRSSLFSSSDGPISSNLFLMILLMEQLKNLRSS
ncbi:hypothetical protein HMPREF1109_1302 [Streptococcus intermedius SK54 = ATCC 27335]|nr:hypothetical protein HMPREF1109_1302 [Streptococcus intermedius SK54 = ATCC 27335]